MNKYMVKTTKYSVRLEDAKVNILKSEFGEESITKLLEMLIDEKLGSVIKTPKKIKSPILRIGGKYNIADKLVALMPEHKRYVDVFGGALHVLFAKPKEMSRIEVVNDKLDDIINFFKVVKNQPYELREAILEMPKSKSYYHELLEMKPSKSLDRAVRFFYLVRNSMYGNISSGFDLPINNSWAVTQKRIADELPYVSERIKNVTLECSPWQHMIKRYGKYEDTLLFIDPPYLLENKKDGLYELPFDLRDTRELAKRLRELTCKIMVVHYENEMYDKYFQGWRKEIIQVHKASGAVEESSYVNADGENVVVRKKPVKTEVVYMNY